MRCEHLDLIIDAIQQNLSKDELLGWEKKSDEEREVVIETIARRNTIQSAQQIYSESATLKKLADCKKIAIVASLYNVDTGRLEILDRASG